VAVTVVESLSSNESH